MSSAADDVSRNFLPEFVGATAVLEHRRSFKGANLTSRSSQLERLSGVVTPERVPFRSLLLTRSRTPSSRWA